MGGGQINIGLRKDLKLKRRRRGGGTQGPAGLGNGHRQVRLV